MPRSTARTFAERFPHEQSAFAQGIRGLPTRQASDYASVLLHRLMFLQFLQQAGFLAGDRDFLGRHLRSKRTQSFWRRFLLPLFHQQRRRSLTQWRGLFIRHVAEEPSSPADVADSAFTRLFAFFDGYDWCLRSTAQDDRLTPAVIGPLFEKYVNRAEQGTYYTKDDVTAYLASRTIIPWLLDAAQQRRPAPFTADGMAWRLLRNDPDRYIPSAVRSETTLPTETKLEERWRRQRCQALRERLRSGAVVTTNELVTLNLDLERFAHDLCTIDDTLLAPSVSAIRVLDPTCGSGAFLVAALRVLHGLAHMCSGASIRQLLSENLFGVDVQAEAVEFCRLRLLLELAAYDDDLGDLAAIVANIRVGNALTGKITASGGHKPPVEDVLSKGVSSTGGLRPPLADTFEWHAEFAEVMHRGGFDVVVGNPPYLPAQRVRRSYSVPGYRTADCPDVYAWVLERSAALLRPGGRCGMIVPLSLGFSDAFASCRRHLFETYSNNWFASFARIPAALFAGNVRVRNTIHIGHRSPAFGGQHTTRLHRWFEVARPHLFQTLEYVSFAPACWQGRVPKLSTSALAIALEGLLANTPRNLADALTPQFTRHVLHFKKTAYNWLTFCRRLPPSLDADGKPTPQTQYDVLSFADATQRDLALLLLNGKLAFAFWAIVGDDFHVAHWMFGELPIDLTVLPRQTVTQLRPLARELERAMRTATAFKRNAGKRVGTYNLARCRQVTDRSDRLFAEALGLLDVWPDLELLLAQVVKTEFDS